MTDAAALTDHTGSWMRMVSNAVSQGFARKLAGAGVTVAEWVVLRSLHGQDPMSPTALAERMGMTKGAISKLADRLLAKGLLAREENRRDRRAHLLSLTGEGRARVPLLAALADRNDAEFFGVLTRDEHATLDRLLRLLADRRGLHATPVD